MPPVRSIGSVRATTGVPGVIYIPPESTASFKLTVQISGGTAEDISTFVTELRIVNETTDAIGDFKFVIWDPNKSYAGKWSGGEIVRYYSDYSATSSTLRFRGIIEKVNYTDNKLEVIGRSDSLKFLDVTVTKKYDTIEVSTILKDLITNYGESAFQADYTNINTTSPEVTLTVNWYQKPFWECVQELTTAAAYDCYVDANLAFHFFEEGSVLNPFEGVIHDFNLLSTGEFAEDLSLIKNRIIIYGAKKSGIQIIYTAQDDDSIAKYGLKEEIINDDNVTSYDQAVDLATYLLEKHKTPPVIGEMTTILLASIQPGDTIRLSDPANNIAPGGYRIVNYEHKISDRDYYTLVKVDLTPRHMSRIMADRIKREYDFNETSTNPYEMKYSYDFLFDDDSGSHTNTQIIDGRLKLQVGQSSGTWISPTRSTPSNITEAYLYSEGDAITGATYYVSANGGVDWESISIKERVVLSTSVGSSLQIKIEIDDTATQIDSATLQYKY